MNNKLVDYNTEYEESSDDEIVEINDCFNNLKEDGYTLPRKS